MESNRSSSSSTSSRLKQRLARMFRSPSLLRSSCKPSTSAPTNLSSAASTRGLLDDAVREPVFVPRRGDHVLDDGLGRSLSFPVLSDHRRHAAAAVSRRPSVDCSGCRPTRALECGQRSLLSARNKKWKDLKATKKERRVRETGGYYETGEWEGRTCPPASPSSPSKSSYYYYCFNGAMKEEKKDEEIKRKMKKKRLPSNGCGFSISSSMGSDDDNEDGFFSSEEREGKGEETETFFSSRSFSSDSSEFYQRPTSKKKKKNKNAKKPQRPHRSRERKYEAWRVCRGFQPLVSVSACAGKKEKRGFAVVKRSSDPYNDFRSSMVEMIIERQIFGAEDLECLLKSYLSLNSPHLHPLILQAFSDIWVVLFGH